MSLTEPTAQRPLLILADDHRDSLARELYRLTAPPTPAQAARMCADKLLVYQALLDAVAGLPAQFVPGILVDEQYGASVAELAAHSSGAIALAMPVEASGKDWFEFAYGDQWRRHADFFAPDYVKVLVRDNPGLDAGEREQQAERLAQVSAWALEVGRPLILELLVPATAQDKAATAGDAGRYDDELRPGLTVQIIGYLQEHGVEPALWKVEGFDQRAGAEAVVEAASRDGRDAQCIVLGRHASREALDRWLAVAAPVPGFVGFAIGRSIWWDALEAHLRAEIDADQARAQIAAEYTGFAQRYLDAR